MLGTLLLQFRPARCFRWNQSYCLFGRCEHIYLVSRTISYYKIVYGCNFKFLDLCKSIRKSLLIKNYKNYSSKQEIKCWNCNKNLEILKFSCLNCGVLQRPNPEMNYFELLDVPENFELDMDDMSSKYKKLQMMFHPDKYVNRSKEEVDISDDYSRLVNKAYSTLKNPLSRGMYILGLKGMSTDDDSVKMDQRFLMEILEKNEELETINDAKSLQEMAQSNSKEISNFIAMATEAFERNDMQSAREVLMKMKYFVNIDSEIKKKKSLMGLVD